MILNLTSKRIVLKAVNHFNLTIMESITENNTKIFDFMGCIHSRVPDIDRYEMATLEYHKSWNALMAVVEKIEALGFEVGICQKSCLIINDYKAIPEPITLEKLPLNKRFETQIAGDSKLEATHKAILAFIQWHNLIKDK